MTDSPSRRAASSSRVGSRRGLLRAAGAGVAVGLAGCLGLLDSSGEYDRSQADFDPEILPGDETYPVDDGVTMFRRGLRRLGYYPDRTVPDAVTVNWQLPINYHGHTAAKASPLPSPDGDTVLFPADTGRLHAVSTNGEHRWTDLTGAANSYGFHGSPAIVDDVAYVGGYDGTMYAYDVDSGDRVWRNELDDPLAIGSSPAYWDGVLYVVSEYSSPPTGTMWALDADSGEALWSDDRLWGQPHPSPAIHPESERIVTGSNDGVVYCWEFPSLEFEWEFETGAEIKGTIPTYDGAAFVGSWDGNVYRLDLEDGTEAWRYEVGEVVMSNPGIDPEAGVVYVGADDWQVHAIDAESGDSLWTTNVDGKVIGSLSVTADAVLVGSYDGGLYALEADGGDVRWRVENNGHVTSEPVLEDDRIYYAERGVVDGYWDDDDETEVVTPGHAYCLVPDE